mgnify:CR=1 FL=1
MAPDNAGRAVVRGDHPECGVSEKKKEIRTKRWTAANSKRDRRGRPEKPLEELSPTYKERKINAERIIQLRTQGHGRAEAKAMVMAEKKQRNNK